MNPTFFRLRIAYAKQDRGRFLSHLEVQRSLQRLIRRTKLPFAVSQGFNPHMRLATGPALSVGVAGAREYCDLTLTRYVKPMDALRQLQTVQTTYLPVLDVGYVNDKDASLNAAISLQEVCATIESSLVGSEELKELTQQRLQAGLEALCARDTLEVEHKKGKTKVFDSATHVPKDVAVVSREGKVQMTFFLRISPAGSLRPDALLTALMREIDLPLLADSVVDGRMELRRVNLYIEDEEGIRRLPLP